MVYLERRRIISDFIAHGAHSVMVEEKTPPGRTVAGLGVYERLGLQGSACRSGRNALPKGITERTVACVIAIVTIRVPELDSVHFGQLLN